MVLIVLANFPRPYISLRLSISNKLHTYEKSLNTLTICFYPINFIQMSIIIAIIWQVSIEVRIIEACKINMSEKVNMRLACDIIK